MGKQCKSVSTGSASHDRGLIPLSTPPPDNASAHTEPDSNSPRDVLPTDLREKIHEAMDFAEAVRSEAVTEEVLQLALGRSRKKFDERVAYYHAQLDLRIAMRKQENRRKRAREIFSIVRTIIGAALLAAPMWFKL